MEINLVKSATQAARSLVSGASATLYSGDCLDLIRKIPDGSIDLTITSPPYCMGKEYERSLSVEDFIAAHRVILPEIARITRDGGSICWQVGYHVAKRVVYPLDYIVFSILKDIPGITLRNRVVWTFDFGRNETFRFSGRHETVLWFTKGSDYFFDLDAIRVPQKYPGKKHYKGPRKGNFSGNPKGKNPGDVWAIPNIKSNHLEKVGHPCQFPVALAERFVRALCPQLGVVFDPYSGSASTGVAAAVNERRFIGSEINETYQEIAHSRLVSAYSGTARFRPAEQPIYIASPNLAVAQRPESFAEAV
jgi:adenine-specific DNA-methyltransferase